MNLARTLSFNRSLLHVTLVIIVVNNQLQHFLPQLLLKGFASRVVGKSFYVQVFRRGKAPYESNICKTAAETGFYDTEDGFDLEAMLSRQESKYSSLLEDLRRGLLTPGHEEQIESFVCNLTQRTKNSRDAFSELFDVFLASTGQLISHPRYRNELENYLVENLVKASRLDTSLDMLPMESRKQLVRLVLKSKEFDLVSHYQQVFDMVRKQLDIGGPVRDGQLRALTALRETRKEGLKDFVWSVNQQLLGTFVLGDVGPVARLSGPNKIFRPAIFTGAIELIVLPVSSQCLLVGTRGTEAYVDIEQVNLASVELSRDFFVASQNTYREQEYALSIGKHASYTQDPQISDDLERFPNKLLE